jgi:hypothetical protein
MLAVTGHGNERSRRGIVMSPKGRVVTITRNRVPAHTSARINRRIRNATLSSVRYYSEHKEEIPRRLRQLDEEWDIERAIEANASLIALAGVALGAAHDRRWLMLPALVTSFLFQHAVQGWCPPVPILRRLGFRTSYEIEEEREALKLLRGDFNRVSTTKKGTAAAALQAARA